MESLPLVVLEGWEVVMVPLRRVVLQKWEGLVATLVVFENGWELLV